MAGRAAKNSDELIQLILEEWSKNTDASDFHSITILTRRKPPAGEPNWTARVIYTKFPEAFDSAVKAVQALYDLRTSDRGAD